MPRRTVPEVFAIIDSTLADNTNGQITPQKIRESFKALGDALKPTTAFLKHPALALTAIGTTSATAKLVAGYTLNGSTDSADLSATIATGKLARPAGGASKISVSGAIVTVTNKNMTLELRKGGVVIKTRNIATSTTAVGFYIDFLDYSAGAAEYTVTLFGSSPTATLNDLSFEAIAFATI